MDYKNYPTQVEYIKWLLDADVVDRKVVERSGFITWKDAYTWAEAVSESVLVPYVILTIRNLNTGDVKVFSHSIDIPDHTQCAI